MTTPKLKAIMSYGFYAGVAVGVVLGRSIDTVGLIILGLLYLVIMNPALPGLVHRRGLRDLALKLVAKGYTTIERFSEIGSAAGRDISTPDTHFDSDPKEGSAEEVGELITRQPETPQMYLMYQPQPMMMAGQPAHFQPQYVSTIPYPQSGAIPYPQSQSPPTVGAVGTVGSRSRAAAHRVPTVGSPIPLPK